MSQYWRGLLERDHVNLHIGIAVAVSAVGLGYIVGGIVRRRNLSKKLQQKRKQCEDAFAAVKQSLNTNSPDKATCEAIWKLSASELQRRLQDGSLSATDVLRAYQIKALRVNECLNCVTEPLPEASEYAAACDRQKDRKGLLHGMPVSLKENFDLANHDTTIGLAQLVGDVKTEESVLVKVVKKQGGIPFVRTNIPQTMLTFECSNPVYGRTDNPHDSSRGPGGSSGGESALLGGGGSILGLGNDIGGSIRIPSHFAGCCGLKTTAERLSRKGTFCFELGQQLVKVTVGPMCRDVDGLVLFMRALLCDYHFKLDPSVPPIPFRDDVYESKRPLRVGYYVNDGYVAAVPACQRAVHMAKTALEMKGHKLVEFVPPRIPYLAPEYMRSICGDGFQDLLAVLHRDVIDPCMADMFFLMKWPRWVQWLFSRFIKFMSKDPVGPDMFLARNGVRTTYEWFKQVELMQAYQDEFQAAWEKQSLDAVICPVFPTPAVPHGDVIHILGGATYSMLYNAINFPAGVLPVTKVTRGDVDNMTSYPTRTLIEKNVAKVMAGSEGLPVGVQCAAPTFQEELVLRVMKDIETALLDTQ